MMAVRERTGRGVGVGVDVDVVMTSGGFATTRTQVMRCQFTLEEVRVVVERRTPPGFR